MENCSKDFNDLHEEQITYWLEHPRLPVSSFKEPVLTEATVEAVKLLCDVLQQTDEVFIESVDVLEDYVHKINGQNKKIRNSILTISCAILVSSKLIGSHPDVRIQSIQGVVSKLTKNYVEKDDIKKKELDVLMALGKLPLCTMATDLGTFLEYYINNLKLKVDIQPLCLEILNMLYICRRKIFCQLKSMYEQSPDSSAVFKHLNCNRMYYPGGILLCAFRITKYKNFLNLQRIAEDIENITSIHHDHLELLAGTIYEYIEL